MTTPYLPPVQTDCVVDLYHGNEIDTPNVAFVSAKLSGVEMIWHKASQGAAEQDPAYAARRLAAEHAGLLWGAYHFCDGTDPASQVSNFLTAAGQGGLTKEGLRYAIDAELNSSSQVTVYQVCQMIYMIHQRTYQWPVLYMGRNGPDNKSTGLDDTDVTSYLAQCDLWLPEYGTQPICPPGFAKWTFHQYTGNGVNGTGFVQGVGWKLDRSYFAGTAADLANWYKGATS